MDYYDRLEPYTKVPAFAAASGPGGFFPSEYGLLDSWNALRGFGDMFSVVYPQLQGIDFRQSATRLQIPVYLAEGRHELSARRLPAVEWFARLEAPAKRLVWFERSGHNPDAEEPGRFNALMINTVLTETYTP